MVRTNPDPLRGVIGSRAEPMLLDGAQLWGSGWAERGQDWVGFSDPGISTLCEERAKVSVSGETLDTDESPTLRWKDR